MCMGTWTRSISLLSKYSTGNKCDYGEQNRMRCKAASAPQCEHCKHEPTQQRAGSGSQKHIFMGLDLKVPHGATSDDLLPVMPVLGSYQCRLVSSDNSQCKIDFATETLSLKTTAVSYCSVSGV
jgi:hypothetical protein